MNVEKINESSLCPAYCKAPFLLLFMGRYTAWTSFSPTPHILPNP